MFWFIIPFVWFIFGFFSARIVLYEMQGEGDLPEEDGWYLLIWSLGGPMGWVGGMLSAEEERVRRDAHFIPKLPNVLKKPPSMKILSRIFFVNWDDRKESVMDD